MVNREISRNDIFLIVVLGVYCFFGKYKFFTIFGISTDYLFWIVLMGIFLIGIIEYHYVEKNKTVFSAAIYILYSGIEMVRGNGYSSTVAFIFAVISILFLFRLMNKSGLYTVLFSVLFYGGLFFSISVIAQLLFPGMINTLREILLSARDYSISQLGYENTTNYLSGLAMNAACAAFFICIFNVMVLSKLLTGGKKIVNGILLMIGMTALLLTQKRMLFLAFLLSVLLTVLICKKNIAYKFKFFLLAAVVIIAGFAYAIENIPAMTIFIDRIFNNSNILSGRENYYEEMLSWFENNPILGVGIGKANSTWGFGGHNCYIQLLAETGIIGFLLYLGMIGSMFFRAVKKLISYWNDSNLMTNSEALYALLISVIGTFVILIYAISGNPFYDYIYCLTFYALLAIPSQIIDYEGI